MDNSKLGKLVPKSIKARRHRKRQSSIAETTSSYSNGESGAGPGSGEGVEEGDTAPRGRSISRQESNDISNPDNNSSMAESEETSLISYDSDPDP
jgi:hypothetical protein